MKSFKRKQIRLGTAAFVLAAVFGLTALFSPAHAVTGGLCVATCLVMKGTVADGVSRVKRSAVEQIVIEHPSGTLAVELSVIGHGPDLTFVYGGGGAHGPALVRGPYFGAEFGLGWKAIDPLAPASR